VLVETIPNTAYFLISVPLEKYLPVVACVPLVLVFNKFFFGKTKAEAFFKPRLIPVTNFAERGLDVCIAIEAVSA
jgi:hypothetical protein